MLPAVILKEPLLAPFAIETLAGTERAALPPDNVTRVPPAEALLSVAVQVAVWLPLRAPGAHDREMRTAGAVSVRFVV
jgi:hypothetical protein